MEENSNINNYFNDHLYQLNYLPSCRYFKKNILKYVDDSDLMVANNRSFSDLICKIELTLEEMFNKKDYFYKKMILYTISEFKFFYDSSITLYMRDNLDYIDTALDLFYLSIVKKKEFSGFSEFLFHFDQLVINYDFQISSIPTVFREFTLRSQNILINELKGIKFFANQLRIYLFHYYTYSIKMEDTSFKEEENGELYYRDKIINLGYISGKYYYHYSPKSTENEFYEFIHSKIKYKGQNLATLIEYSNRLKNKYKDYSLTQKKERSKLTHEDKYLIELIESYDRTTKQAYIFFEELMSAYEF